jgi:four helix bundle protein
MAFDALEVAIELAKVMRRLLEKIRRHDKDLADQMKRATTSIALCAGEGQRRLGRDREHLYSIAAGSTGEVGVGLRVALALGYVEEDDPDAVAAKRLIGRENAMFWRLTHRRS